MGTGSGNILALLTGAYQDSNYLVSQSKFSSSLSAGYCLQKRSNLPKNRPVREDERTVWRRPGFAQFHKLITDQYGMKNIRIVHQNLSESNRLTISWSSTTIKPRCHHGKATLRFFLISCQSFSMNIPFTSLFIRFFFFKAKYASSKIIDLPSSSSQGLYFGFELSVNSTDLLRNRMWRLLKTRRGAAAAPCSRWTLGLSVRQRRAVKSPIGIYLFHPKKMWNCHFVASSFIKLGHKLAACWNNDLFYYLVTRRAEFWYEMILQKHRFCRHSACLRLIIYLEICFLLLQMVKNELFIVFYVL